MLHDGSFVSGHSRSHPELASLPPSPARVAELLPIKLRQLPAQTVVFASFNAPCALPYSFSDARRSFGPCAVAPCRLARVRWPACAGLR
jgi:hypothetical protein